MKSGNLNFLEPSGPLHTCNGTALPVYISYMKHKWYACVHKSKSMDLIQFIIYKPSNYICWWRCVTHECMFPIFLCTFVNSVVVTVFLQVCWWISSQFRWQLALLLPRPLSLPVPNWKVCWVSHSRPMVSLTLYTKCGIILLRHDRGTLP